jgi:hypothetical protein
MPTNASKNYLNVFQKKLGWIIGRTEQYNSFIHRKIDLWGFVDMVAIVPDRLGLTLLQVTTGSGNGSKRCTKIVEECRAVAAAAIRAGNFIEVWQFRWYKPRGTKKKFLDALRWSITADWKTGKLAVEKLPKLSELLESLPTKAAPSPPPTSRKPVVRRVKRSR